MNTTHPRAIAALLLTLIVAACGSGSGGASPSASTGAPSTAAPSASEAAASPTAPAEPAKVRLALDWTPNTNHTGFYVAQAKGWYDEAGIALDVLPYGGTTPETILAAGQAECGISFQDSLTFAVAAGAPITSVMAILQHTAQEIAVLESSSITRPKQLDGKTYAGFGYPNEVPTLKSVIAHDGGTGEFDVVTLDTAAYEALYAKRADFVITFAAWEGIEAGPARHPAAHVQVHGLRVPGLLPGRPRLQRRLAGREPGRREGVRRGDGQGLRVRRGEPRRGGADPAWTRTRACSTRTRSSPAASQAYMTEQGLLTDAAGAVGTQTLETWTGYSSFLYDQGLLVDANGKALTAPPDYATLFTTDFLP